MTNSDWAKVRARGKWRYIGMAGVLQWGLPMLVVLTIGRALSGKNVLERPVVQILVCLAGGAIFGWLQWRTKERAFDRSSQ
jgi:hypothetical protein